MKMIPYGKQQISPEDIEAVAKALQSDFLTQGPMIKQFEQALCDYTGAKFAVTFSSGTAALHGAYATAGLTANHEAITTPISFAASSNAMMYCGAKPVFADIDPSSALITPSTVVPVITDKTKLITAVDLRGHPVDIAGFRTLADKNNLTLVRDAAHSLGATYSVSGKTYKVGSCSHEDLCCFSFHPIKSITTLEGGAVLTNRQDLYDRLQLFKQHGITKAKDKYVSSEFKNEAWYYEMIDLGYNYRMTDVQSALGLSQLKTLDQKISRRREIVSVYEQELKHLVRFLRSDDKNNQSGHHVAVILVPDGRRNELARRLKDKNIGTQVHYIPIYRHPYYQNQFGTNVHDFPNAETYFSQTLSLPLFPDLSESEQQYILDCVKRFFQ